MPFDGMMLGLIAGQLRREILNARIQRIYQPSRDDIVFYFSDSRLRPLLVSASGSAPRAHLTQPGGDNPSSPPVFCMVLRKYLTGGIIRDIIQKDFDRILILKIEALDEAGNLRRLSLICEMMGKHSNISLVDEDMKILDAIKHISGLKSSYRRVMPGFDYVFPPNEKTDPLGEDSSPALDMLSFQSGRPPEKALVSVFSGLSTQAAMSFLNEQGIEARDLSAVGADTISRIPSELKKWIEGRLSAGRCFIYFDDEGRRKDVSCGYYSALSYMKSEETDDPSRAVDDLWRDRSLASGVRQQYENTIRTVEQLCQRERKKLEVREKELESASDGEKYQRAGNLIIANIYKLKKGMDRAELDDVYAGDGSTVEVELKKELDPSQNAQYYFKRYARSKNAAKHLRGLIEENRRDFEFLSEQLFYLKNAENYAEAEEVLGVLAEHGFIKRQKPKGGITRSRRTDYLRYTSSDGYRILAGRNSIQNGELTFREAGRNDLWLHVKDVPASHVILFTDRGNYSDTALEEAAMIAAAHSDLRDSDRVPVDYTYAGNVKKIPGSPYANVTFTDNRTVIITPDFKRIEELRDNG